MIWFKYLGILYRSKRLAYRTLMSENDERLNDLTFLVDIRPTGHLNNFNLKKHGSNKFVRRWCLYQNETRAIALVKQLSGKKFHNFQCLRERVAAEDLDECKYTSEVADVFNAS